MYVVAVCYCCTIKKMCTALLRIGLGWRTPARTTPPLPLLPLLSSTSRLVLYSTSNAQLTLMLKAWMGGCFEKICITVSFELGIIRITGACHLLCCVAFDLLYSAYLQTLCNILLVLLSLIHVNVIEILEEATATETDCCSCWQDGSNNVTARYQVPA